MIHTDAVPLVDPTGMAVWVVVLFVVRIIYGRRGGVGGWKGLRGDCYVCVSLALENLSLFLFLSHRQKGDFEHFWGVDGWGLHGCEVGRGGGAHRETRGMT